MKTKTLWSHSPAETREIAIRLGQAIPAGTVIAAQGDLGAGKTLFAAGLAAGLGVTEPVVSPTFTIYQEYPGRIPLAHVDAYRLEGLDEEEVALTGIDDALTRDKAAFIEWPDYIRDRLPADAIWLAIRRGPEPNLAPDLRELEFSYLEKETWLDEALSH